MPRVSRPAEPASRRKHGVAAIIRIGSSASSRISSRYTDVKRHLGRRDAPQVVALDGEGVVGELGQLAAGRERRRRHQRRRADLLEGVGVAVEGELAQRPAERGAEAARHHEHRAADLDRPLDVEDPERRRRVPVRDALVVGELVRQAVRTVDDRVVGVRRAVGDVGVDEVRDPQQQAAQGRRRSSCSSASSCSTSPSSRLSACAPRPRPRRRRGAAADLLRQLVDPGPTSSRSAVRSRSCGCRARRPASSCSSSAGSPRRAVAVRTAFGVAAQQPDVDHERRNLPAIRWPAPASARRPAGGGRTPATRRRTSADPRRGPTISRRRRQRQRPRRYWCSSR